MCKDSPPVSYYVALLSNNLQPKKSLVGTGDNN